MNAAYQRAERMGNIAQRRRRIADPAIRARVTVAEEDLAELMGVEPDASAWSPDDAEWLATFHNVVAEEPWRPSLVRKGERPRVRRPRSFIVPNGDIGAALTAERAKLKGKMGGRNAKLIKARIARLEAIAALIS